MRASPFKMGLRRLRLMSILRFALCPIRVLRRHRQAVITCDPYHRCNAGRRKLEFTNEDHRIRKIALDVVVYISYYLRQNTYSSQVKPKPMSLSKFIRDNTDEGHNIARVLIDVMEGRLDGCKISHRLTAARLLTIYGNDDAPDFIADNAPDTPESERGDKIWVNIDPGLLTLVKTRTDDGRVLCLFLIDVMEGRVAKANVGHRVSAAKELLNRAFGKSRSRDLPRLPGSNSPKRSAHKTHQRVASTQTQAVDTVPAASTAVLTEPEQQAEPATSGSEPTIYIDSDDPLYLNEDILEWFEMCDDPEFDPYEATRNEHYAQSYTGCPNPKCEVHGEPDEIEFDPKDFHD